MVHEILPIPSECPWSSWSRPNLRWCEEMQCGYIVTPINAWTNLFYLVVAILMWRRLSSIRGGEKSFLRWFPWAAISVGITSFAYHASYTLFFQYADFLGMFSYLCVPITLASGVKSKGVFYLCLFGASSIAMFVFSSAKIPYQLLVLALIITGV